MLNLSHGSLLLILYCIFAYILPLILIYTSSIDLSQLYDIDHFDVAYVTFSILFVLLISLKKKSTRKSIEIDGEPHVTFLLVLLAIQVWLVVDLQIYSLRYEIGSLAKFGAWTAVYYTIVQIEQFFLFYTILYVKNKKNKINALIVISISLLFSINGVASVMPPLISIAALIDTKFKLGILQTATIRNRRPHRYNRYLLIIPMLMSGLILFQVGLAVKEGRTVENFTDGTEHYLTYEYLAERLSPSIASLDIRLEQVTVEGDIVSPHVYSVICLNSVRLANLFGVSNSNSSSCRSVMRANFLNIDRDKILPGGTAPGLIASILYLTDNLIAAIILTIIVVRVYIKIFDKILDTGVQLTLLGYVAVLILIQGLFSSVPDYLNIIDDSFVMLLLYVTLYFCRNKIKYRK